jgi:phosphohistidine phosphatase
MSKTVFFIRHAKSSWSDPTLPDIKRPLNQRGLRDAPFMAQLLSQQIQAEVPVFTSPAVRAHTTAQYFADAFNQEIEIIDQMYLAAPDTILNVVRGFDDRFDQALLFGHNPGMTSIANWFSQTAIANVPTCGIVEVRYDGETWKEFGLEKTIAIRFQYPKQYFS